MKNLLATFIGFCLVAGVWAQMTSGKIVFEEKMDLHAKLPPQAEQFKDRIPQFKKFSKVLWFTPEVSKYEKFEAPEKPVVREGGGFRMEFGGMSDENEIVHDIKNGAKLEYKDFMGRTFIIDDKEIADLTWKIGAGQKEILGYVCQEAMHIGKRDTVLAWFAPQIPVSTGPRGFSKLPGMILGLEMGDGFLTIEAKEISDETLDPAEMKIKGKGKKVTKAEFEAIVEEKTKEMEGQNEGNVVVKVRTR